MRDEMNVEPVDSELNRLADSIAALVNEAKKHKNIWPGLRM